MFKKNQGCSCCPLCNIYSIYFKSITLKKTFWQVGHNISSRGLMCETGNHWDCQLVRKKTQTMFSNHYKYGLKKASERQSCRSGKAFGHQCRLTTLTRIKSDTQIHRGWELIKSGRQRSSKKPFLTCCVREGGQQYGIKKGCIHPLTRAMAINTNKI